MGDASCGARGAETETRDVVPDPDDRRTAVSDALIRPEMRPRFRGYDAGGLRRPSIGAPRGFRYRPMARQVDLHPLLPLSRGCFGRCLQGEGASPARPARPASRGARLSSPSQRTRRAAREERLQGKGGCAIAGARCAGKNEVRDRAAATCAAELEGGLNLALGQASGQARVVPVCASSRWPVRRAFA
jgi:hypothetical protein